MCQKLSVQGLISCCCRLCVYRYYNRIIFHTNYYWIYKYRVYYRQYYANVQNVYEYPYLLTVKCVYVICMYVPMHKYSQLSLHLCTNTQLYKCSSRLIIGYESNWKLKIIIFGLNEGGSERGRSRYFLFSCLPNSSFHLRTSIAKIKR